MRRAVIMALLILLISLPLVVQPAPYGSDLAQVQGANLWSNMPSKKGGSIFTPGQILAQEQEGPQSRAQVLNDPGNVHKKTDEPTTPDTGYEVAPDDQADEAAPPPKPSLDAGGYLQNGWLIWEELMPAGWDPSAIFEDLNINDMADDDPRVDQIIEEFLKRWNDSPVNPEVNAKRLKIPGFVVPLDFEEEKVDEFFLVPFFGACIHVPPPPPNQIVLVRLKDPIEGLGVMEVVWVYGKISVEKVSTEIGSSGYSLAADKVEFYDVEGETGMNREGTADPGEG